MSTDPTETVLIARDSVERNRPGRVYVTGPHIGETFSSTRNRAEASRFTRAEAERLLRLRKWFNDNPMIEVA